MTNKPNDINEYIALFPENVQKLLEQIRSIIQKAAPEAIEAISYAMPTFKLNGILVHFAAFQNHIGFYALPSGNEAFQKELSAYKTGKGSIQFPLNEPLPEALITKIVKFRAQENIDKALMKKKK
ncbi:iron chaperone [Flavobacterium cerinum]|uniref:YdhG-like domain-containing protein n=1 Tax=Flavobacterium cerinum TaxID=2502784 RepID=A0A444HDY2_9FLAO|nr:DUF1801 domain-containing protein [Flavobacterium cerinum]RWX02489.1 hypothetical protein EPI11_04525 [Flavobacterium cerinum]